MNQHRTPPTTLKSLSADRTQAIGRAIDRWLRDQRNSPRIWEQLLTACDGVKSEQITGQTPLAEMVRLWLRYREAERRTHSRDGAIDEFNQAYAAWQHWKRRGS